MKKVFVFVLFSLGLLAAKAQKADWPAMHQFHGVMSKTFHPAEEGNLQPLKDSASSLLAKAVAWQASAVPAGYNAKVTAPILKKLVRQCGIVKKAVAAGKPDAELTAQITKAHDIFHEIMEKCRE